MSINEALILMKKADLIEKSGLTQQFIVNINMPEIKLKNTVFIISMTLPAYVVLIINV